MSAPPPPGGPYPPPPGWPGQYPGGPPPQPPWGPQQSWPGPQPKRGNTWKWVLGAIAVVAVIGVTAAITLAVAGKDSGDHPPTAGPPTSDSGAGSAIASVDDKGPATVITEDPTCAASRLVFDTFASQQRNGWEKRDPSIPASAWTPAMRSQYQLVGQAMRGAADQMVQFVKLTPHRTMRELYEQFIAYSRAYADRIPNYTPPDNNLALVSVTTGNTIGDVCAAISYGSAPTWGPLVLPSSAPSQVAPLGNPEEPERFLIEPSPVCSDWRAVLSQFQDDTVAWVATDPDIPASQWTPEQRAINDAVAPVMNEVANKLEALSERSGNPTLQDLGTLSAQYRRAYLRALPSYTPADKYLANASLKLSGVVLAACQATKE